MAVLAVLDDLVFQAKLEAAAAQAGVMLRVARDVTSVHKSLPHEPWQLVIVDLNLSFGDPVAIVTAIRQLVPTPTPLIGYCSHVQTALKARAQQAGCTAVLPRSVFVQSLPTLLTGTMPMRA